MQEMLVEYKIHTSAIFITELTLYYDEILSKTGGDPPHTKEVKESCWALVTKLLRTILKEVHKVRWFAAEAVSIGTDSLSTNGMFLYAALEELRVLREFASCDWCNHPKFNRVFLNFDRFGGAAKSGARGQISGSPRLVHWGSGSPRSAVHTLHSLIS
jgi:hypothetical protein